MKFLKNVTKRKRTNEGNERGKTYEVNDRDRIIY